MQRLMILIGVTALATVALYVWGFVVPVEVPLSASARVAAARPVGGEPAPAPVSASSVAEPPVAAQPEPVQPAPAELQRPAGRMGKHAVPPEPEVVDGGVEPDMGGELIGDGIAPEDVDEDTAADATSDPTEMNRRIMEEYQAELDRQAELQQMEYSRLNPAAASEPEPEAEEPPPPEDEGQPVD